MKPVREPDAGNPHVRFDERRRGNGLAMGLGEQVSESDPCATGSDPSNRYRASRRLYKESYGFVVSVRIFPPVQLVGGNFPNPAGGPGVFRKIFSYNEVRREGASIQRVEVPPKELGRYALVADRRGKAR